MSRALVLHAFAVAAFGGLAMLVLRRRPGDPADAALRAGATLGLAALLLLPAAWLWSGGARMEAVGLSTGLAFALGGARLGAVLERRRSSPTGPREALPRVLVAFTAAVAVHATLGEGPLLPSVTAGLGAFCLAACWRLKGTALRVVCHACAAAALGLLLARLRPELAAAVALGGAGGALVQSVAAWRRAGV
jgi:hypothetical protein